MDDYISRQKAREVFLRHLSRQSNREQAVIDWHTAKMLLGIIPAADVRPVVFCKDCKWFNPANSGWLCEFKNGLICPGEDDFCSFGERRDGGADG